MSNYLHTAQPGQPLTRGLGRLLVLALAAGLLAGATACEVDVDDRVSTPEVKARVDSDPPEVKIDLDD